jgi:hypothetical protein
MAGDIIVTLPSTRAIPSSDLAHAAPPNAATAAPSSAAAASKRPLLNPSVHVDLALNIAILQFVDDKGNVTESIPSEKQLKAYRDQASSAPKITDAVARQ